MLRAALSSAELVEDLEAFCNSPPAKKKAAVYAVYGIDGEARYVGIARDVHSALASHLVSQPAGERARAAYEAFDRPSRDAMAAVQESWIAELDSVPIGNSGSGAESVLWTQPPLSAADVEKKLKLRQASADSTLQEDDPVAWSAVVQKAMKDGEFDGSAADMLDADEQATRRAALRSAAGDSDDKALRRAALRRAAGDWEGEIEAQTVETLQAFGRQQVPALEMYSAPGCPHCDRMRSALKAVGAVVNEYDVEGDDDKTQRRGGGEALRRARHARINTVPQLYVLRQPPLRGKKAEHLVGGADDLEAELSSGAFELELWS